MAKPQGLIQRLLNTRDLPAIVPRLQPEILHRVIHTCGLEDCAELIALATPAQLARVLDADVWRSVRPGRDEAFDADRFGLWLAVLMESGPDVAAEKLAGLDIKLVTAGLARHIAAFEYAARASYTTLDGEHVPARQPYDGLTCEVGGHLIHALRTSAWDAIIELLAFLNAERPDYFHDLMRGCVRLSNGPREQDGSHDLLDDRGQNMFDLAGGREDRRDARGYVAPAQAAAFLRAARSVRLDGEPPQRDATARAYFRAIASPATTDADAPAQTAPPTGQQEPARSAPEPDPRAVAAFVELLAQEGVLANQPRALLEAGQERAGGLSLLQAHAVLHQESEGELAYLANAIVAGCSIQGRPFTVQEGLDCAASVCNLGLEGWPPHWPERDLISAFQVGWTILHRDVCLCAARRLIDVLGGIRCSDREVDLQLEGLRRGLIEHVAKDTPWRAADALDVILVLDATCWAALLGLIAECPVIHAALVASAQSRRSVAPTDFEFISRGSQLAAVREFLGALPTLLTG
jgi:hypothetical protein